MEREFIMAALRTSIANSTTKLQFADLASTVLFIIFRKREEITSGINVGGLYRICGHVPPWVGTKWVFPRRSRLAHQSIRRSAGRC